MAFGFLYCPVSSGFNFWMYSGSLLYSWYSESSQLCILAWIFYYSYFWALREKQKTNLQTCKLILSVLGNCLAWFLWWVFFFFSFLCFLFPLPNRCWIIPLICFLCWSTFHCYNKVLKSISLQAEEIYFPSVLVVPAQEVGLAALRTMMR